ncbi:MAG: long-chain fatty acid--CoA ligase [Solirubrobacterales bacterium]|nr:long-chain fatty acid--CoA ligase [Solirubrobacterales bacterium]
MNLAETLTSTAETGPDRLAIKLDDLELNYGFLDHASKLAAGFLAERGVSAGDTVAISLPNVPYFPVVYYGILRLGATAVPLNVLNKAREINYYLTDSGAKLLFNWHDFDAEGLTGAKEAGVEGVSVKPGEFEQLLSGHELFEDVADRAPDDTAVILYTSGTTGQPKGAELTHANLAKNAEVARNLFGLEESGVVLGALPLFHSFGQTCTMNATFGGGGMLTLIPRFDPAKALEIIQRDKVQVFEGVPTMYGAMLNLPSHEQYDTSTLEICASGGAALPVEVLKGFQEAFNCKVLEGYGLSETSPVATFNHPEREQKPGSIGTPIEGVEVKLFDEQDHEVPAGEVGEIVVRGHNVMKGYLNRPEATEKAMRGGWFHTGDMATQDQDGYFFIVDRKKDMIIRNGFNVYPREVEEVLYANPAVREAAVIGLPHDEFGEEIGAAVALKEGAHTTPEQLRDYVKAQVAAYKYPRHVWIVDDLPKGPTGKILKREIKAPAELSS